VAENPGGYVFRGDDGSLYLIRDEILEACKMGGGDLDYARSQESDVEGFMISASGPFTSFARVDYSAAPTFTNVGVPTAGLSRSYDTVMCGW
jgi:hypothetical protein